MKHVRMLWICIVAAFAVAGVAATSASALPEWGQCFKKGTGSKYTDANCTKKSSLKTPGEFEFKKNTEVANKKFTNSGGASLLEGIYILCSPAEKRVPSCAAGETEISIPLPMECSAETSTGETAGTKEVKNVVFKFTGCVDPQIGSCSTGATAGEVVYNALKGSLGYINKATKEVGLLLEPAAKKHPFVTVKCGTTVFVVGVGNEAEGAAYSPTKTGGFDGVIAPIKPANVMTTSFTQLYSVNEEARENVPSHFEGKHIDLLESYFLGSSSHSSKWSKADLILSNTTTTESEVEIHA